MRDSFIIVCARVEEETVIARAGQIDIGRQHTFAKKNTPRALVWKLKGQLEDLDKAKLWASSEGYEVFTYSLSEAHPLEKARAEILSGKVPA